MVEYGTVIMCESVSMHLETILTNLFGIVHNIIVVPYNYLDIQEEDLLQDPVEDYY